MNKYNEFCGSDHRIIYKGKKKSDYQPEWLVCEHCHEKRILDINE